MSIFLDETIIHEPLSKMIVFQYVSVLQYIALQHGVEMTINQQTQVMKRKITETFFEQFAWEMKEHERIFKDTTVLAILSEPHLHVYEPLKKQFGGKWDISSQVISEERIKEFYKILQQHRIVSFNPIDEQQVQRAATIIQNERSLPYTFYNVLLGLYVKSGMQPWVLNEKTYSDCFIGLDVSHEKGKSTAGIINVIGNDGRLMKQAAMNGTNAGEKISQELLKEVLQEVMHLYKTEYNGLPTHMTIHRDGFWREDTQTVTDFLNHLDISFDIVEIIKEPNRRMAYYNHVSKNYETRQGTYYQRNQEALLCATDPREQVGMAKPLKVIQKTTTLPFEQIIHDVYMLSFMHVHALNKTRLPITTHYADLSSTFYQRGMLVPRTTNETNLPFV